MRDIPVEVTHGATAAAVGQLHRVEHVRRLTEDQRQREVRLDKIVRWVAAQPSLLVDGEPCAIAVAGAIWLRREHPDATAAELVELIQRYRRLQLERDFTPAEADAWMAGHLAESLR
jgi:hypothetical protein